MCCNGVTFFGRFMTVFFSIFLVNSLADNQQLFLCNIFSSFESNIIAARDWCRFFLRSPNRHTTYYGNVKEIAVTPETLTQIPTFLLSFEKLECEPKNKKNIKSEAKMSTLKPSTNFIFIFIMNGINIAFKERHKKVGKNHSPCILNGVKWWINLFHLANRTE